MRFGFDDDWFEEERAGAGGVYRQEEVCEEDECWRLLVQGLSVSPGVAWGEVFDRRASMGC